MVVVVVFKLNKKDWLDWNLCHFFFSELQVLYGRGEGGTLRKNVLKVTNLDSKLMRIINLVFIRSLRKCENFALCLLLQI